MEKDRREWPVWRGWDTVKKIGSGRFGTVYEIEKDDWGIIEKAALKVIRLPQNEGDIKNLRMEGKSDEDITETFCQYKEDIKKEFELTQKLSSGENIVHSDGIEEQCHEDGLGWDILIKMELLTPLLAAHPEAVLEEETVIEIGVDLCRALEQCRKNNIVHRDVKPQNIFRSNDGTYKLGDFGIAKTVEKTVGGTMIGTYKYMAPEVYAHEPYGTAADQYSLGLVLYWLLNERRMPFETLPPAKLRSGEEDEAREKRFSGEEQLPAPKHGSEWLKHVVLKACSYDPKNRYENPTEMRKALEDRIDPGETETRKSSTRPRQKSKKRLRPVVMGGAAALLLVFAILMGVKLLRSNQPEESTSVQLWTLQEREHTMQVGEEYQLLFHLEGTDVLPENVKWFSSDERIAAVDASNGKIIAKASGSAVITLSDGEQEEQCVVNVETLEEKEEKKEESTKEPEVAAMNLNAKQAKTEYFIGEDFDGSGLKIEIKYDNGDVETVSDGFTSDFDSSSPGKKTVSIHYQNEKVGSYQITVNKAEVSSIRVINYPVTSLTEGEKLNLSGLAIEATYNNGDTKVVSEGDSGLSCAPVTFTSTGKQTVTVSYGGATTTFDVQIAEIGRYSVSLSSSNEKYGSVSGGGTYKEGDTVTLTASPRSGCVFDSWSDGKTSESRTITVTENCDLVAYFYGPLMDYTPEDEIPSNAMLVGSAKTQYQYQKKEYTTSSQSSLDGWTVYDNTYTWSDYGPYGEWTDMTGAIIHGEDQKVERRKVYHYYYYLCNNCGAHMHGYGTCYTWAGGCGSKTYSGDYHGVWAEKTYDETSDWHGTGVRYVYADEGLCFAYTSQTSKYYEQPKEQYRIASRQKVYTYSFYRYGAAYWSDLKDTSDDVKLINSRLLYQYRQQ